MLMHSVAIRTDCPEDSYEFYTGVLGLKDLTQYFGAKPGCWWLGSQSILIELKAFPERDDMGIQPGPLDNGLCQINLVVADLDHAWRFLAKCDARIVRRPYRPETGHPNQERIMFAAAPEGTLIQLREPRQQRDHDLVPRLGIEPRTRNLKGCCSAN